MKKLKGTWIKLKETINEEDYELINELQELCEKEDKTSLKLELDYKLSASLVNDNATCLKNANEFMFFDDQYLIGYVGICHFGETASPIEVNGMVHPKYRQQGIFKKLFNLVIEEWKRRNSGDMLLLCDKKSKPGQEFIKNIGAQFKHTEYEMYLKDDILKLLQGNMSGITLRKATNQDAGEIARQNVIYFNSNSEETLESNGQDIILDENLMQPEDEEKRGMTIYIAEKDQQIIGKVHLQMTSNIGGIYGLGVLPKHRGKGYGRAILIMAIKKLQETNASEVMLQVDSENNIAFNLYKSCGFIETSAMDYYELQIN